MEKEEQIQEIYAKLLTKMSKIIEEAEKELANLRRKKDVIHQ